MNSKRELYNIPRDFAYLNTAYFGCFSNKTTEIAVQSAKLKAQPWNITIPDFYTDAEKARTLFSRLINTSEDNIAIIFFYRRTKSRNGSYSCSTKGKEKIIW